jgi:hypothetical protein
MGDVRGDARGSPLSRLDRFQKWVALGGAVITAWGAYVTVQTSRNANDLRQIEAKLTTLKEERLWAKELYSQFDAIVSGKADEQARIDRLAGLLALTELTDQRDLKAQWALLIKQQAGRYAAALTAHSAPGNAAIAEQIQQYRQLQQDATATVRQAKPSWSNYDFDIFWCPGAANQAAAEGIARLAKEDPNAKGNWRLKPLRGDEPVIGNKRPLSIIWDHDDELPYAQMLARRLKELDIAQLRGADLRLLRSSPQETRWYLSVFVCR